MPPARKQNSSNQVSMRWQWNHRVHLEWAKERLFFVRLAFEPTYNRLHCLEGLHVALIECHVTSYAIYETIGTYDLMLRVWLPTLHTDDDLEQALLAALKPHNLSHTAIFHVQRTIRSWVWPPANDTSGTVRVPTPERLNDGLPRASVEAANAAELDDAALIELEQQGLLAAAPPTRGIKFFVVITGSAAGLSSNQARQEFVDCIDGILLRAESIHEKSLYLGEGFGRLLLMGRVDYVDYHAITRELIDRVNSEAMPAAFGARTYTHLASMEDFLAYQEHLPLSDSDQVETQPISHLLSVPEHDGLEVKGSAFADLGRAFKSPNKQMERSDEVTDVVVKTVAGFLNSGGGRLVIGAVERRDFSRSELPTNAVEVGPYAVIGLSSDYQVLNSDWDAFARRVRNGIERGIRSRPTLWFTIERQEFMDHEVCVLEVRKPDRWFYVYPKKESVPIFYVRSGNETIPLAGPDADDYRASNPR